MFSLDPNFLYFSFSKASSQRDTGYALPWHGNKESWKGGERALASCGCERDAPKQSVHTANISASIVCKCTHRHTYIPKCICIYMEMKESIPQGQELHNSRTRCRRASWSLPLPDPIPPRDSSCSNNRERMRLRKSSQQRRDNSPPPALMQVYNVPRGSRWPAS